MTSQKAASPLPGTPVAPPAQNQSWVQRMKARWHSIIGH
ncbi:exported hypothetical protein [Candidatus Sulfopaludibacter sp. SbA3]|nr:exported hypothetical protein [Candidatus Sulfopaludibacter sp. SbA3]